MSEGERYYLDGGVWRRAGRPDVTPGQYPGDAAPPVAERHVQIASIHATASGGGPTDPPPPPVTAGTLFGACPPSGTSHSTVISKWGDGPHSRLFWGPAANFPSTLPAVPAGCSGFHLSFKPPFATILSGFLDSQIADIALQAAELIAAGRQIDPRFRGAIEIWHESDKKAAESSTDGAGTTITVANATAVKNHFYDVVKATAPTVEVIHTLTGGALTTAGGRWNQWTGVKADLLGADLDGVHDSTAPLNINWYGAIDRAAAWATDFGDLGYTGWCAPEFGTSRPTYDTTGELRTQWSRDVTAYCADKGAVYVDLYDVESTVGNTFTTGSPEYNLWRELVAANNWP